MRLYNLSVLGILAGTQVLFGASLQPAGYYAGISDGANEFVPAGPGATAVESGCPLSTSTRTGCGYAYASAGQLGDQASLHDTDTGSLIEESFSALSYSRDILTISDPAGSGTYMLVPTVTIDGTASWNGAIVPGRPPVVVSVLAWGPDGTTETQDLGFNVTVPSYSQTLQLQGIPFQPGTPFDFMLGFYISARVFQPSTGATSTDVNADFLSTMRITGLSVLDPNGNTVGSFSIQSASGAIYGPNGVSTTPEPATLPLVIAGILSIAVFGKAKRRRQEEEL